MSKLPALFSAFFHHFKQAHSHALHRIREKKEAGPLRLVMSVKNIFVRYGHFYPN
jgi:hypothetical protein